MRGRPQEHEELILIHIGIDKEVKEWLKAHDINISELCRNYLSGLILEKKGLKEDPDVKAIEGIYISQLKPSFKIIKNNKGALSHQTIKINAILKSIGKPPITEKQADKLSQIFG